MKSGNDAKHFLFEQLEKLQQFSSIGMPLMLVMNLAVSIFAYVQWRDVHPYIGIPLLTFIIMLIYWGTAHLVVRKGETYKSRARAMTKYSPYAVWAIAPFQWMLMKYMWFPVLERTAETDEEKAEVRMVKNWMDIGYIPRKDFPDNLKEFYIAKEEERL